MKIINERLMSLAYVDALLADDNYTAMDEWPQALYTDEPSVDDYDTAMNAILREFYENDKYKDITFIVAKTEVPANEVIVKVRSPVLKAMLESPTRDSTGKIALDDLNLENFKKFLEFLYTNDCSINGQNVFGLFLLGKKYDVPALIKKCMDYFEKHLTKNNAPTYAVSTLKNPEISEFFEKCYKLGAMDGMSFYNVDKYGNADSVFSSELVLQILRIDRSDDAEERIFAKILEWSKVYCQLNGLPEGSTNIKEAMKDFIPYIRFENLKYVTLAEVVHPYALLSAEELLNCFCNKALKEEEEEEAAAATV